jgi:tungstate transport system ATP-binding protein
MSTLLEIQDLKITRCGRLVLEIDHLQVIKGQVLAVVGPNGAGKSTLLLALAKLLKPARGFIRFSGAPLEDWPDLAYRRRIGLVLQEPLLLNRSVYANVTTGLHFRHLPKAQVNQRAQAWLDKLGIAPLSRRRASQLSGGEAQRVSLARVFALQPELLLLDEPFTGLDTPTRLRLLDDLAGILRETGVTAIFITHDFSEVTRFAHQVAVILENRLQQVGSPEEVQSAPQNAAVAAFLRAY